MKLLYEKTLSAEHADDVWELLAAADLEFIPPLSSRSGPTDKTLDGGGAAALL